MDQHACEGPASGWDSPMYLVEEDGDITELTREESGMLRFRRCLPDDLQPEFDKVFVDDGRPFATRLADFEAKAKPRSREFTGHWAP